MPSKRRKELDLVAYISRFEAEQDVRFKCEGSQPDLLLVALVGALNLGGSCRSFAMLLFCLVCHSSRLPWNLINSSNIRGAWTTRIVSAQLEPVPRNSALPRTIHIYGRWIWTFSRLFFDCATNCICVDYLYWLLWLLYKHCKDKCWNTFFVAVQCIGLPQLYNKGSRPFNLICC